MGALGTLIEIIEFQLLYERQVHLSTLGIFYLNLASEGKAKGEEHKEIQETFEGPFKNF